MWFLVSLGRMEYLFAIHFGVTWALVGLIWVIQIVHYPLFGEVGKEAFKIYHQRHSTLITWLVGPMMLLELASAVVLSAGPFRSVWMRGSLVLLLFVWGCTWLVQVPLHQKLAEGFDWQMHRRLVTTNWWRTIGWTLRGICLFFVMR